jgi:putative transposase
MLDKDDKDLSIRKQCKLLRVNRSNLYYQHLPPSDETLLANEIHELWLEMPYYGYRRITAELQRREYNINHKRVLRLMRDMNLKALYPKPKKTIYNYEHRIYPYLLRDLKIVRPDQVWATDITYIRMPDGFIYLVALIDIFSRFILGWNFSNTLNARFCEEMLGQALLQGRPEILNTDQGCQFTSNSWINLVEGSNIKISMDGKGRWADNIFIERFWRTLKHEHVLINSFETVKEAKASIGKFIDIYNYKRLHQSLGYKTPAEAYKI